MKKSLSDQRVKTSEKMNLNLIPGLPDDVAINCLVRVPIQFHCVLKSVCKDWNKLLSGLLFYRIRKLAGNSEDLIFMLRTQTSSYEVGLYNATYKAWLKLPQLECFKYNNYVIKSASLGSKVVIFNHNSPTCEISFFDLKCPGKGWQFGATMLTIRRSFVSAVVGGALYVVGETEPPSVHRAEAYDIESDSWRQLPDLHHQGIICRGFAVAGQFVVISVFGAHLLGLDEKYVTIDAYDPQATEWHSLYKVHNIAIDRFSMFFSGGCVVVRGSIGERALMLWRIEKMNSMISRDYVLREYNVEMQNSVVLCRFPQSGTLIHFYMQMLDSLDGLPHSLFVSALMLSSSGHNKPTQITYTMNVETLEWSLVQTNALRSYYQVHPNPVTNAAFLQL